jgi:hypothetical protein
MNSADFLTILAAVLVVLIAAATGIATYLSSRHSASGKVETTEAAILWQQSQDMRAMLLAQLGKTEEQRDRLIEGYTHQMLPMLESINSGLKDLTAAVAGNMGSVQRMSARLEGGDRDEMAAQTQEGPERR